MRPKLIVSIIYIGALCVFITPKSSHALQKALTYTARRQGSNIGSADIAVTKNGDMTCVDYRLKVTVKKLGVPVYSTSRFQRAAFDRNGALIEGISDSKVNNDEHKVTVKKEGGNYLLQTDGHETKISKLDGTTLTPLVQPKVKSGNWLDLRCVIFDE